MLMTDFTRSALAYRRAVKALELAGFVRIAENGDPLWKLMRGGWINRVIEDVKIAPGGHELWIKVSAT